MITAALRLVGGGQGPDAGPAFGLVGPWLVLLLCPVLAALTAAVAARLTAMALLREMP